MTQSRKPESMNRMVLFSIRTICLGGLLAVIFNGRSDGGDELPQDPRVGKSVIITTAGAELKTPDATVWKAYPGEVYPITTVNGEWLWIQERRGWLWERDCVLFDDAIRITSDRLAKSRSAENYHVRGVVYVAHRLYERALSDFTESLKLNPRNAGVLNNRGQCHYLMKNHAVAISDFDAAVQIEPKHFVALNNRALAKIASGRLENARADVQRALTINPKYPEALLNRGVIHENTGHSKKAIKDYTAALKIDSRYSEAYGNRAYSYRVLGDYGKAIADLNEAIKLSPTNYEPINDLAFLLATAKDDSVRDGPKAVALAEQACEMIGGKHWNTLDTLAVARAEVNDFTGATTVLLEAIELAPDEVKERIQDHHKQIAARQAIRE